MYFNPPYQSSSNQNALTLRVKLNLSKYFVEKNQMELADPWELDLLKPIELMIWSIPFFLWSKNIAPQRLTIRSAFSWKIMKSLNQNAKGDQEYLNQRYEKKEAALSMLLILWLFSQKSDNIYSMELILLSLHHSCEFVI